MITVKDKIHKMTKKELINTLNNGIEIAEFKINCLKIYIHKGDKEKIERKIKTLKTQIEQYKKDIEWIKGIN